MLTQKDCTEIRAMYADATLFRSRIDMQRYRFGRGEYQYFAYPLPSVIAKLRAALYSVLAPVARDWTQATAILARFLAPKEGPA